ncbi:flagellar assembly protein FliW [Diaminobutyricimonas sp. TR449]|uniref:flagellar assembly protein FliW n=1 Tax=Diaminobutyricimonas sp. TR449 TaxID=2708076 RepID=UPI001421171F|nr:flagellar assembly protein FliW [Diaminobutyricimonas sp. TR449]
MSQSLSFVTPPPGLERFSDFSLDEIAGADGLYALRATEDSDIRLFVIDAAVHLPNYQPVISDEQSASLGLTDPDDAAVLVVANPQAERTTMNLMAPIVVNRSSGRSAQLILENQDWPLQAELAARG